MFPSRLTMIQSQTTLSCHHLTKKQLAQEMWTCKDPLCHTPHHQTPTGYHSIPYTSVPQDLRSCHQESSEHGSIMTLTPRQCTGASPHQPAIPDPSPHHHLIVPRFVISSPPKDNTKKLLGKGLPKLPDKGPQRSRQCLACHRLAEDAAHALLLGASCHSHLYSLKF
jgi:hypothetical protein